MTVHGLWTGQDWHLDGRDFMCPRQMPQTAKMVGEAEKLGLRVLADKPIE